MLTYYNEWEKYPAEGLRNLIPAERVTEGLADEDDAKEVFPEAEKDL